MPFRGHNRALDIVNTAAAGGYAVPAMCCFNLEGILATVKAAEAKRSPAIIQLFPCAIEFADGLLIHAAKEAAGFDEKLYGMCIKRGVAKVNINGAMNSHFTAVLAEKAGKIPLTELLQKRVQAMQEAVELRMDWLGSIGKAP
ncbi:hypothetical protein V2G26_015658 [Clonostachys chloroleuca]